MGRHSAATVNAYLLALAVVGAGIAASVASGTWSWFARSGAFVVVIGIVLTSSQIIEDERRLRQRRQQRDRAGNVANRDWASEDSRLAQSRRHDEHLFENERSGLYMLVAGTLIWGFGDLLGWLFIP